MNLSPLAFAVYVFYRAILYGTYRAVAELYGYERLGRLLGVLFTIASLVGLLQYPLAWWAVRHVAAATAGPTLLTSRSSSSSSSSQTAAATVA